MSEGGYMEDSSAGNACAVVDQLAAGIKKHCPNLYDIAVANKEVKVMKPKVKVEEGARLAKRTQEEIEEEQRIVEQQRKAAAAAEMSKISKRLEPKLESSVQALAYVPKSGGAQVWAGCSDGNLIMWSDKGKKLETAPAHQGQIFSVYPVAPDSVWTSSVDKTIRIYNTKTNKLKKEMKGFQVICLQRVGKNIWGGSTDAYVYIFDPKSGKQKKKFKAVENGPICSILPVEHQGLVWLGTDCPGKTIVRVNIKNGKVLDFKESHSKKVTGMLEINGLIWTCSADKTIRVWSADNGECLKILHGHTGPVYGLMHVRGKVWSCSWDKTVILWDSEYQVFFKEYEAHADAASCLVHVESTKHVWSGSWDQTLLDWTPSS